jgi:diguanylate cyclase (GGDEF)-like protein
MGTDTATMPTATTEQRAILIVDDTPANLKVMSDYLGSCGFRVVVARDGEEGLQRAKFLRPDLILLDVVMPRMNGFETCRRLKECYETFDIPVIFMTALTDVEDKVTGFEAGGADYVTKPFQMSEVLARVNAHLELRSMREKLVAQNTQLQQEAETRRQAEAALQRAHDELEQRVASRTAQLAETNARLKVKIDEHKRAEERIRYMADHDALTGLPNRTLAEAHITSAIAPARAGHAMTGVLFIDLDHFRHINDSLGHHVGDMVLRDSAARLRKCIDDADSSCTAHLGGDKFVIVLPGIADSDAAARNAQKAVDALCRPFIVAGRELHMRGSIGISLFPVDGSDAQTLMRAAETAMYYAKERGRGNFQFSTAPLNDAAQRRLSMISRLHQALARDEFLLHYQPQWDMESGRILSSEALLRWRQQDASLISASEFIGTAEDTGLILPIGEFALREACSQLSRWRRAGHPDLRVAVNLSARQLYEPGFENVVKRVLRETELPADALELEITETLFMLPREDSIRTLKELAAMGIQLSMDDFGTGYSSLAYLQRLPLHVLKIDRAFVTSIGQSDCDGAIVVAIIAMANSLHLRIIAEGVETAEQASFLKACGCTVAQGFHYSQPVPPQVLTEMLTRQSAGNVTNRI